MADMKKRNIVYRFFRRGRRELLLLLLPEIIDYGWRLTAIETAYKVAAGDDIPHNRAMNNQNARKAITSDIIKKMGVELIVETGTYLGASSVWFAQFGVPVHTSEISSPYYYSARKHFEKSGITNIVAANCDSRELLKKIIAEGNGNKQAFIYLDAHWFSDLPLIEEIAIIDDGFNDYIIMIDDFKVPGDKGYGFDRYSITKNLDINYIGNLVRSRKMQVYFPSVPSADETGAKRGYVYLAKSEKNCKILDDTKGITKYSLG